MNRFENIVSLFCLATVVGASALPARAQTDDNQWKEIKSVASGKEYPRSVFVPFQHKDSALLFKNDASTFYQPLNKKWKFKLATSPATVDADFVQPSYDVSAWSEISVPGNWQTNGYNKAVYADSSYEFTPLRADLASLPAQTPVGMYRTTFKVPYLWSDRETFLHIGAVKSGCYVWVNGQRVGYTEDSKNPAEFDITPYVKEGMNTLALEVYGWSTGSYLESQDFWRLNGLDREVYLVSQPRVRVRDFVVESSLDPSYTNGNLKLGVVVKSHFLNAKEIKLFYDVIDPAGNTISYESKESKHRMRNEDTVYFHTLIPNVKKWSADSPNLYTVLIRLQREKRFAEHIAFKVGFRNVGMQDNKLTINGVPLKIKGVNLHEHHPQTGHAVDTATLMKDFALMKRLNINAIQTSGYPQSDLFYELCDAYGFYVFDQANINSKAMGYDRRKGGSLANNPEWLEAHIDRTLNMYERNKNHPSVIAWSLGSDAGNGYNFYKTYQLLKSKELHRPVIYTNAGQEWNTDVVFPQYPTLKEITAYGKSNNDRPYIIAKILPSFSRDVEKLPAIWAEVERNPALQGGFIADWVDQGLVVDGAISYGSDRQLNHPSKGIVTPNRELNSGAERLTELFRDIRIVPVEAAKGEFQVVNGFDIADLSDFQLGYKIKKGDQVVKTGEIDLTAKAGQSETVALPLAEIKMNGSAPYRVELSVHLKAATPILEKEYSFASGTYSLSK